MCDTSVVALAAKVDYEQGFTKTVRDESSQDHPERVGACDFHWKQLLRRKLSASRVPRDVSKALIEQT